MKLRFWALLALSALSFGCDDGGGGDDADAAVADMEVPPPNVPYVGTIAPLPAGTEINPEDHFPLAEGSVWRYRKKATDPFNPPAVEQGGESLVRSVNSLEDGTQEVVRRTITIIDLTLDGTKKKVRQTIDETFIVTPSNMLVGPKVQYKNLHIEERVVEDQAFVRVLDRDYSPPYLFIEDAWKVGIVQTQIQVSDIRLVQSLQRAGEEEPAETQGLVTIRVEVDPVGEGRGAVVPMEGEYREDIRKITVFDDFSGAVQRTYSVQPGVGMVQWQFAATNNISFTLTETNLEAEAAPPMMEMPEE